MVNLADVALVMGGSKPMQKWLKLGCFKLGGAAILGVVLAAPVSVMAINLAIPARAQGTGPSEAVSEETVEQFARVVLALEPFRLKALDDTNSTSDRTEQNDIRREFIRQATEVIEGHEMSVPDYNRITIQLREDDDLKARIEDAIRSLQQENIEG